MFSNLVLRNSRRSRKENGLFFASLILSVVAFYIILSISKQDVMLFLQKMESDAVNRLLTLIPVFYCMTLIILFFLIYFACKYQMERRRHEFGVYLMMGMRRSRLFGLLFAEDLCNSVLVLAIGLPVAILLTELISLVTAKLVGMGIIGHQLTLSLSAVFWTVAGFLAIKLLAFLILSGKISRQEIGSLLTDTPKGSKKQKPTVFYGVSAICGIVMLAAAYTLAIRGYSWQRIDTMALTMLLGLAGTLLLFYGMRTLIGLLIKVGASNQKLRVFHFRQIQENVIYQSTSMAISSLLILAALCCFGAGVGIASNHQSAAHVLDYTFRDNTQKPPETVFPMVESLLSENGLRDSFSQLFEMRIGHIHTTQESEEAYTMESVMDALRQLPASADTHLLLNNLGYAEYPYLICLSDYNKLLELAGAPALALEPDEAAVYIDSSFLPANPRKIMNTILSEHPEVQVDGASVYLTEQVQSINLVTDRSITLSFALILPDDAFFDYTQGEYSTYVNGVLSQDAIGSAGLITVFSDLNDKLDQLDLESMGILYESYLKNMGRQLFYTVAASYITIYLAIIFLVVANTIMGVQFLMSQQKTGRRYQTLVRIGASYQTLCGCARKQINWFFGLPIFVAAISSLFGVKSLFSGLLPSQASGTQLQMLAISGAVILLLCVVECIYLTVVKRSSDRYLLTLMEPQREE